MSATKKLTEVKAKPKREAPNDVPQFFRLNVEVGDLDAATSFYTKLLGVQGRQRAVCRTRMFTMRREVASSCDPWGERSFYVEDPWKNPLCFVEEGTVYTG